jgi:trans-aconitate methyltransferase
MNPKQNWNPELYEARHSFVWQLGQGLVELLQPAKNERILDLGCGTGQLTHQIAESGAQVTGIDSSPAMIGQARQNYPAIRFVLGDAAAMQFAAEFDAIFSNAALHWMLNPAAVANSMFRALKPGGRLVAEMGGKGNIGHIEQALDTVLSRWGQAPPSKNYFPSIGQYSAILENAGFEVRMAQLFDRPTPLEGEQGMTNWLRQFRGYSFEGLNSRDREKALTEVVEHLRPSLYRDSQWFADYRRLRIVAVKL